MKARPIRWPVLLLAGIASASSAAPDGRAGEDYAFATCLTAQPSDYLKEQGYGLAAIATNRSAGSPQRWAAVAAAVRAELKRRPMLTVHGDGPVGSDRAMPIAYCLSVVRALPVRAKIQRAKRIISVRSGSR